MAGHYWNPEGRDVCSSHPKGEPLGAQSREETLENGPKRQTIKVSLHFSFKLKINFIWGTYPTKVVRNSVLQGRPLLHRANFFLHCIRTCCWDGHCPSLPSKRGGPVALRHGIHRAFTRVENTEECDAVQIHQQTSPTAQSPSRGTGSRPWSQLLTGSCCPFSRLDHLLALASAFARLLTKPQLFSPSTWNALAHYL